MTWLIDTFLVTGALIALVLVLRRPVARAFGPGMAYALWALPLLRLALPPLLLPAAREAEPVTVVVSSGAVETATAALPAAGISPLTVLAAIWLVGALFYLAWRVAGYIDMRRQLLTGARPVGEAGAVRLVETAATAAPVAFGVRDKVVALPLGFMAGEDRAARDLAIAHELEHHAGRDLAVNLAVQPLLALHWFNPLAWAGWRALRRDQEAACDARVLAGRDAETRARYARLISDYARSPRLALAAPMACPVLGDKSIVHRLRSLTMTEPSTRRRLTGTALIAAAALALPATASIVYAAQDAPPAPPVAVTAPTPAAAPHAETRVMIIERHGKDGKHDRGPGFTRTITRDGRTIVLKTDKPISDAELDAKLAEIDAHMPMPPMPPMPGVAPTAPMPPRVVMIRREGGDGEARAFAMHCAGDVANVDESTDAKGQHQVVRMRICGDAGAHRAEALEAIRHARQGIASDTSMSPEIRAKVLSRLDAEIAKLSKTG